MSFNLKLWKCLCLRGGIGSFAGNSITHLSLTKWKKRVVREIMMHRHFNSNAWAFIYLPIRNVESNQVEFEIDVHEFLAIKVEFPASSLRHDGAYAHKRVHPLKHTYSWKWLKICLTQISMRLIKLYSSILKNSNQTHNTITWFILIHTRTHTQTSNANSV